MRSLIDAVTTTLALVCYKCDAMAMPDALRVHAPELARIRSVTELENMNTWL